MDTGWWLKFQAGFIEKGIYEQRLEGGELIIGCLLIFPNQNKSFIKQETSFFISYNPCAWCLSGPQKSLWGE